MEIKNVELFEIVCSLNLVAINILGSNFMKFSQFLSGLTLLMLFMLSIFSTSSLAIDVNGPFDIEIPVEPQQSNKMNSNNQQPNSQQSDSQQPNNQQHNNSNIRGAAAAQNELIQKAFKDMLVRATGQEKILTTKAVAKALTRIDDYVKQFSYRQSHEHGRTFRVQFNEYMVSDLIQQANFKIISHRNRPPVLVWAIVSQNNDHRWMGESNESDPIATQEFARIAKRLGISILFPLFDIDDGNLVTDQNVVNHQFDNIIEASKRYGAQSILVGRLSKQPSGWYAEWTLFKNGASETWDNSQLELNALLAESVEALTSHLETIEGYGNEPLDDNFHMTQLNVNSNLNMNSKFIILR